MHEKVIELLGHIATTSNWSYTKLDEIAQEFGGEDGLAVDEQITHLLNHLSPLDIVKRMSVRPVELAIGGQSWWYTDYVDIPADTPSDEIEKVARRTFLEAYEGDESIAFVTLYNVPE